MPINHPNTQRMLVQMIVLYYLERAGQSLSLSLTSPPPWLGSSLTLNVLAWSTSAASDASTPTLPKDFCIYLYDGRQSSHKACPQGWPTRLQKEKQDGGERRWGCCSAEQMKAQRAVSILPGWQQVLPSGSSSTSFAKPSLHFWRPALRHMLDGEVHNLSRF